MTPAPRGRPWDWAPGPIPHTLSDHACIDFVNSRFSDHTGGGRDFDRLELDEWRRWFLERCGLSSHPPPHLRMHGELVGLRSLLRRLLESRRPPSDEDVAQLNYWLSRSAQRWELVRDRAGVQLERRWSDSGWPAAMALMAASYVELLVSGRIRRVRVCANPSCSFIFCDGSRNASRRWCDVAVCGNLVKVRRHRATA
ncbi:MAG: ABATE domain-containing protein [Candidatus Dormibacter sp.]